MPWPVASGGLKKLKSTQALVHHKRTTCQDTTIAFFERKSYRTGRPLGIRNSRRLRCVASPVRYGLASCAPRASRWAADSCPVRLRYRWFGAWLASAPGNRISWRCSVCGECDGALAVQPSRRCCCGQFAWRRCA